MGKLITLICPLFCIFFCGTIGLSYLPMSDFVLTLSSEAIIKGNVIQQSQSQAASNFAFTLYLVEVTECIKGGLSGVIMVTVPGGVNPSTKDTLIIPGGPAFGKFDSVLLFLRRWGDSWALNQLSLGEFYILKDPSTTTEYAVRPVDLRTSPTAKVLDAFVNWLKYYSQPVPPTPSGGGGGGGGLGGGVAPPDNYTVQVDVAALQQLAGYQQMAKRYRLFSYAGLNLRWFEFDQEKTVTFQTDSVGQPGYPGGGFAEIDAAMNAWNSAAGARIAYRRAGTTNSTSGLWSSDGINSILFNDPSEYISGSFDCNVGGFLAFAGYWTRGDSALFNGVSYVKITEADLVVQDGIQCWWSSMPVSNASMNLQALYAHELGHTLGLAHSCNTNEVCSASETDALMNAYIHTDGRGPSIRADDLAAIRVLYPDPSATTASPQNPTTPALVAETTTVAPTTTAPPPPPSTTTTTTTTAPATTASPPTSSLTTPPPPPSVTYDPLTPAARIPGRVEFENFDRGGEGFGYHDTEPANLGGEYRLSEGVDIGRIPSGYSVGWTKEGEWLRYSVQVTFSGWYLVRVRVASPNRDAQGVITIELGQGSDLSSFGKVQKIVVPDTTTWDSWASAVTEPLPLTAGNWTLTVRMVSISNFSNAVGNFDYLHFHLLQPFEGQLLPLPNTLSAVNFDYGGEGIAYHALTPHTNTVARPETTMELVGNSAVRLRSGEWTQYTALVSVAGYYTIRVQASGAAGVVLRLSMDENVLADFTMPSSSVSGVVLAYTNAHIFRVEVLGEGATLDLQSITFTLDPPAAGSLFLRTNWRMDQRVGASASLTSVPAFAGKLRLPNIVTWTATGLTGTYTPGGSTKFSLQVDAKSAQRNAIVAEIAYDWNGDGKFERIEQYNSFSIDSISMVYSTYTESVGTRSTRGSGFTNMRNGSVRLRIWNVGGNAPSYVKVNDNALAASLLVVPFVFDS